MATIVQPSRAQMSAAARARLQHPRRRGTFRDVDAARRQLARLSVADQRGQARIDWLIDLETQQVADARFLAFGSLASHPIADRFCELALEQALDDALAIDPLQVCRDLRDTPDEPAFGAEVDEADIAAFITELQQAAAAARATLVVLPKPVEVERYARKREADWNDKDQAWLPLSLMKKIMRVQAAGEAALSERFDVTDDAWAIEGLHDDFQVVVSFTSALASDQHAIAASLLQDALRATVHPQITVEEAEA